MSLGRLIFIGTLFVIVLLSPVLIGFTTNKVLKKRFVKNHKKIGIIIGIFTAILVGIFLSRLGNKVLIGC